MVKFFHEMGERGKRLEALGAQSAGEQYGEGGGKREDKRNHVRWDGLK